MTSAREETIVRRVINEIKRRGGHAQKVHGTAFGHGTVDVLGCLDGRMLQIEVKRPGHKPTIRQINTLARWSKVGALTGVVTSADDMRDLLDVWF